MTGKGYILQCLSWLPAETDGRWQTHADILSAQVLKYFPTWPYNKQQFSSHLLLAVPPPLACLSKMDVFLPGLGPAAWPVLFSGLRTCVVRPYSTLQ